MLRFAFGASLLMVATSAFADSAMQSDWSGGPDAQGPAGSWGDSFWTASGLDWSIQPGQLTLSQSIGEHIVASGFDEPRGIASADIDGDGDEDIACAGGAGLRWWENADGSGEEWTERSISGAADEFVFLGDLDGDGDVDALGTLSDAVTWWENADGSGTGWTTHGIGPVMTRPVGPVAADLDCDGDEDVVCANFTYNDGKIYWWENMDGTGTGWTPHQIQGGSSGFLFISPGDVDSDGDVDVLGAAVYASDVVWFENLDGSGSTWQMLVIDDQFDSSLEAYPSDFDGDGDMDVLGGGTGEDAVTWWENQDGSGSGWTKHIVASLWSYGSACPDELDGDGDIDILIADLYGDTFRWYENANSIGTSWTEHVICVVEFYDCAYDICADDFGGDGRKDVLGSVMNGDQILWWDLAPTRGSLTSSILYTGCDPGWGSLSWNSLTPPQTKVSFQVRASDDYTQMGSWSDTLTAPCSLEGILANGASYLQYRAILTTAGPETTPTLLDVTITWDPLSTGEGEGPAVLELLSFSPNPSSGPIAVSFGLPSNTVASFSVFDVSGRTVAQAPAAEYPAGYQQIQLGELPPGIYICRMKAGSFTAIRRFAVVE